MVCLGFEPGTSEWKAQTKPQSYGGRPICRMSFQIRLKMHGTRIFYNTLPEVVLYDWREVD